MVSQQKTRAVGNIRDYCTVLCKYWNTEEKRTETRLHTRGHCKQRNTVDVGLMK